MLLFTGWGIFFLPFVFGATLDGCVHNSSKVNAAGQRALSSTQCHQAEELLRLGHEHFSPQYTPSLHAQGQICLCWGLGSWRMKHPRSQSCAHCCYAKKRDFPDEVLKLEFSWSLSHAVSWLLVGCIFWSQDQIIWSWGSGHEQVNVNRLKSRKQDFSQKFLSSLCYLLRSKVTRLVGAIESHTSKQIKPSLE